MISDIYLPNKGPERPQERTSNGDEGGSMPEQNDSGSDGIYNNEELLTRCFGYDCEYVSYRELDGKRVLWCSKEKKTVYNTKRCPFENCYKDEKGRIHKG